jgi:hypothetical protein
MWKFRLMNPKKARTAIAMIAKTTMSSPSAFLFVLRKFKLIDIL